MKVKLSAVFVLFALLTACFYEQLSWSPDGRWLIFPSDEKNEIWRWDSQTHQSERVDFKSQLPGTTDIGKVKGCHYLPSGSQILLVTETEDGAGDSKGGLWLADLKNQNQATLITSGSTALSYDVAPDGRVLYVEEVKEKQRYTLNVFKNGKRTQLLASAKEIGFPRLSPDGRQVGYSTDNAMELLDLDRQTTRTLLHGDKQHYYWPSWVDAGHLAYCRETEGHDDSGLGGTLELLTLADGTTRTLCERVSESDPPSFTPDRKRVAVTALRPATQGETINESLPLYRQIAQIELKTGARSWLTDEDFGAAQPAYSPDGRSLAFKGGDLVNVLDLKTGARTIACRDDENERLWAAADTLARTGEPVQGLGVLRELLKRLPEDGTSKEAEDIEALRQMAFYRMATLYLQPPLEDADKAWEMIRKLEKEGREQALVKFWRPQDRVATDPAGDWITTWNTPEAEKAWGENTDLARDLRGLWVRQGKERVYVRVDYASGKDLSGIALQDTVMLFDTNFRNVPDGAHTRIGLHGEWDRYATAQVIIRHWFAESAQYDAEVRFPKDEANLRFLGAGFAPAEGSPVEWMGTTGGKTPGVSWALSRNRLNLGDSGFGLQVVTLKGGIGADKLKEKPLGEGCDVADAFGAENTLARVKADAAQSSGTQGLCVIKGYVGVVEAKKK